MTFLDLFSITLSGILTNPASWVWGGALALVILSARRNSEP